MLTLQIPQKVKFICGFIYNDLDNYKKTIAILKSKFGPIDFESEELIFNHTKYYSNEMGPALKKTFISFKKVYSCEEFIKIKLFCVKLERKLSNQNKRTVNIDPGYINLARLVLLTTKDFAHRIYLGKSVFAEVTLQYVGDGFKDLPWTFPDYCTNKYKEIFTAIRKIYKKQISA